MRANALLRMRTMLGLIAGALLYGQRLIVRSTHLANFGSKHEDMRPFFHGADAILFLAAVIVCGFSFVRIKRVGGELCYDPSNPYWRLMKWSYGKEWGDRVSLCKSYWLTVWLLGGPSVVVVSLTCFAVFVVPEIYHEICKDPYEAGKSALLAIGGIGALTTVVGFCAWLTSKASWLGYVWASVGVVMAVGSLVVLPIGTIAHDRQITISSASGIYSEWVSLIIGCGALLALLIWAAFRFIPWLAHTWLGQMLGVLKDKICPTLVACQCPQSQEAAGD